MKYYLELSELHDLTFRLQKDKSWKKIADRAIQPEDYLTDNAQAIIDLQVDDAEMTLDGVKWMVAPTSGSLFSSLRALHYDTYVLRIGKAPVPSFTQMLLAIANGDDRRSNRLVLKTDGMFEVRDCDDDVRTMKDPSVVLRHESVTSGGGFMGKDSALDTGYWSPWFRDSLESWIQHLKTGATNEYSDYHTKESLEELEKQLEDFA